ncbi:ABC transporter permease [Paractinoplanes ferrugineus]|uniref:ABC transporter substrate-binding protein n=1 Tax=Paractinoplanes ferrugineus TaxID=113564 RepID=A0A919J5T4_9ACTN|nr:FtsX family ABC transporter permease [Actinoplanes ferrugineus]GIE14558.1 ABC transporter substrate-binding protein [Actinoplanes ferrugineus]
MNAVLRTQLRGIGRRPARLLLTGLAVLVVSFVVFATVLAQTITERSVLNGLSGTPEAVDLVVSNGTVGTTELAAIAKLPGVAETVGRVEAGGQIGAEYLNVSGDPGSGPLSVIKLTSGRLATAPGEVTVTARTADRLGLKVGGTTKATFEYSDEGKPLNPRTLTVVGIVSGPEDYGFQAYAPQSTVSTLINTKFLQRIDVRLDGGSDTSGVRDQIATIVAAGAAKVKDGTKPAVETGAEVRLAEARQKAADVDDVFTVIFVFVAVSVVAAGLVAASTFRIVFAQRMKQLALLRAVGAGRGGLSLSLAVEGVLTGLVTGTVGVLLALGAGHLVPALARAFGPDIASPGFPLEPALLTIVLAVVITTVAVVSPAFTAARVSPLEALRGSGTTGGRTDIGKLRWAVGLLMFAIAGSLAAFVISQLPGRDPKDYDPTQNMLAVVASGGFAFLALIALGPALVRPVLAVLGMPIRRSGPVGRLAAGGVGGAPRRAAAVSVVVALGVTLIAGALVGGASIRLLADREVASSAPADYELTARDEPLITAAAVDTLKSRKELTNVTPYRRLEIQFAGHDIKGLDANDLNIAALPELKKLDVAAGSLADLGPGKIAISGFTSDLTGLQVGDKATVSHEAKKATLTVVAKLPDSAPLGSAAVIDPADLTALGAGAGFSGLLADASTTGEQGRTDGRRALTDLNAQSGGGQWGVNVLADQRDEIDQQLTILLGIALGLIGLTVMIAVVGVGTTTALSVVERVRESGLLRAVGLSRGALRIMLTTESALYGVIGAALGLLLGVPYAWLLVKALGVNAPLSLPVAQLAVVFVILVLLTAAAGILPARRAAKVSPVAALGTE